MIRAAAIVLLLLPAATAAEQGPVIPDEETKACALKRAYHMNGDSMVRWGAIDLSKEDPCPKTVKTIPVKPPPKPEGERKLR
jgi:hypothetical protein